MSKVHPMLDDVQGLGLMVGMEIVTDKKSRNPASHEVLCTILDEALKENVILGRGGFYFNRIRFQPPLTISRSQAERAISAFDKALTITEKKYG